MLEGMSELFAKLDALGGNIKQASRKSIRKSAKKGQGQAKFLVAVGETGDLRNSIKTKDTETEEGVEAKIYTNKEYGPYVEFGTGERGAASNISRPDNISYKAEWPGQAAQPYMSPTYLYLKNNKIVEKDLKGEVQTEIKKLESGKK